jgi:phasin family protein
MSNAKIVKNALSPNAATTPQSDEPVAIQPEAAEALVTVVDQSLAEAVVPTKVEMAAKIGPDIFKGYADILQFSKDNLEALITSGNIVVRGVEDLSKTVVTLAKESLEDSVAASKALVGAKTLKEVVDLSSSLAKSNFDKVVAESSKFGQLSSKLAEEAYAPINSRVEAAVQKLTKSAA